MSTTPEEFDKSQRPPSKEDGSVPELINDLGSIITATKSPIEVNDIVTRLEKAQKYHLLKSHFKPSEHYIFPSQFVGGCNRSFRYKWLDEFKPWLVYSCKLHAAFCVCCALFSNHGDTKKILVNAPFTKWHHRSKVVVKHQNSTKHKEAVEKAEYFIHSIERPETNIAVIVDHNKQANITENRHILKCIAEAVLLCGRQCIALRGNNENVASSGNPGNFLAVLRTIAGHDEILKRHLEKPKLKNATYLSPETQNEMIDVIGKNLIQAGIVQEIQDAKFYTILVDEVTSHNVELMPLCVRFVDKDDNIREELLEICTLPRITGQHIATKIKEVLTNLGIMLADCRGQGYDGASNMSSNNVGVQALIRKDAPKASYMHCNGHCLNLVIAHSCALPVVRNMIGKMKATVNFFLYSPKREQLLKEVANKEEGSKTGSKKPLIDVCRTRWAARHDSYTHFYNSYIPIVKSLEVICLGLHTDEYSSDYTTGYDTKSKTEARGLLAGLEMFEFVITFMTVYQMLAHLAGITIKLQSRSLDIVKAFSMVEEVQMVYQSMRDNINQDFDTIYDQALKLATQLSIEPTKPRTAAMQQHRSNAPSETVKEFFLRNLAVPFLDHLIVNLEERFSPLAQASARLLYLIPSILIDKEVEMAPAVALYQDDLPSSQLLEQELKHWKLKWQGKSIENIPNSCAKAIKECDIDTFPNIHQLLKIACTLPVTSCECERSASVIRRLNTFMRSSMSEERLSSLALMHVHYDMEIDLDEAVNKFSNLHTRKLELGSVLLPHT